ncbi:hypothetical protein ABT301_19720 [Streptomyces sp. NPDC000987]
MTEPTPTQEPSSSAPESPPSAEPSSSAHEQEPQLAGRVPVSVSAAGARV